MRRDITCQVYDTVMLYVWHVMFGVSMMGQVHAIIPLEWWEDAICMIQRCLAHDTLMIKWPRFTIHHQTIIGVWYHDAWCVAQRCLVDGTVMIHDIVILGVWYSDVWCMIPWCLVCCSSNTVHTRSAASSDWITSLIFCRPPDSSSRMMAVSYTKHRHIIHQTSLYHTPNITVSYTKHHCI